MAPTRSVKHARQRFAATHRKTILARVDEILAGRPRTALETDYGIPSGTWKGWWWGKKTPPSLTDLGHLARCAAVSLHWLVFGEGPKYARELGASQDELYLQLGRNVEHTLASAPYRLPPGARHFIPRGAELRAAVCSAIASAAIANGRAEWLREQQQLSEALVGYAQLPGLTAEQQQRLRRAALAQFWLRAEEDLLPGYGPAVALLDEPADSPLANINDPWDSLAARNTAPEALVPARTLGAKDAP